MKKFIIFVFLLAFPSVCLAKDATTKVLPSNGDNTQQPSVAEDTELQTRIKLEKKNFLQDALPITSFCKVQIPIFYYPKINSKEETPPLYMVNSDGTENIKICDEFVDSVYISPNGNYLLLTSGGISKDLSMRTSSVKIFLYDLKEKTLKLLKEIIANTSEKEFIYIFELAISPDSQSFIYYIKTNIENKNFDWATKTDEIHLFDIKNLNDKLLLQNAHLTTLNMGFVREYLFWDRNGKDIYFIEDMGERHPEWKKKGMSKTDIPEMIVRFNTVSSQKQYIDGWWDWEDGFFNRNKRKRERLESILNNKVVAKKELGLAINYVAISEEGEQIYMGPRQGQEYMNCFYENRKGEKKTLFTFLNAVLGYEGLSIVNRPFWLPGGKYVVLNYMNQIIILEPVANKKGILADGVHFLPIDAEDKEKWVYQ